LKEGESVIEFGYKVHMWMNKTIEYTAELKYRGCGNGGCAFGAKSRKTDCGGKSLLFCAAMRANNIPARVLQGQFAHVDPSEYSFLELLRICIE
jgi:transglutaminase-like putative cysteine protease